MKPEGYAWAPPRDAYEQLMRLAREGQATRDPGRVQALIPLGAHLNQDSMAVLERVDMEAVAVYWFLEVQA